MLSLITAWLTGIIWFGMEAASIGEAHSLAETWALLWPVASETRFGSVLAGRFALLGVAAILLPLERHRPRAGAAVAGLALILQADLGHAAAMGGRESAGLIATETLHLLAAGAWLGGLVPFMLVLSASSAPLAAIAARRFSPLGLSCVLILAATATAQGFELIGSAAGLIGTAFGRVALVKVALFLVLLAIAAFNRFRLTSAMATARGEWARRRMVQTVGAETFTGLLVVFAAGVLASLPPAMHMHMQQMPMQMGQPEAPLPGSPAQVIGSSPEGGPGTARPGTAGEGHVHAH
jgi:copper resistance protein D